MLGLAAWFVTISSNYKSLLSVTPHVISFVIAQQIDISTDASITKYVGPNDALNNLHYMPSDLVDLNEGLFLQVQGGIGQIRQEAFDHLADMALEFYRVFKRKLVVVSSFRTYGLQVSLFNGYGEEDGFAAAATYSARPGHSEHQLGLTLDLFTANTAFAGGYDGYYDWLRQNAHKRGFVQSYQKGRQTDGYIIEPWHWRYLGKPLATWLYLNNMTFAEWVNRYKKLIDK